MTLRRILFLFSFCAIALGVYCADMAISQEASQTKDASAALQDSGKQADQDDGARRGRQGRRGGRGAGGGRGGATPDDTTGFVQIFNGQSLEKWDGDPKFWRVEEGVIVGQSTSDNRVEYNSFLIWRGGTVKDFELKAEVRLTGGNSGIQYRSKENEQRRWSVAGYQADFDADNRYSGMIYGEQGGGFLAPRGNFLRRTSGGQRLIATLGNAEELAAVYKPAEFNQFHIIAKGNTLLHFVNGRLLAGLIDEDEAGGGYATEGILGLQMHTGSPMKIEARNIWYKKL
jgi:hypothetical protein